MSPEAKALIANARGRRYDMERLGEMISDLCNLAENQAQVIEVAREVFLDPISRSSASKRLGKALAILDKVKV